ncbi:hypothetical protein [Streptomyces sp. NPDC001657]
MTFELFEGGRTVAPALVASLGADGRYGLPATQGSGEDAVRRLLADRE